MIKLLKGDCLIRMKEIPDKSVDAVITDPPYELGFMGKSWDSTGIANSVEVWKQGLCVC
jgi:DNA modification methylase